MGWAVSNASIIQPMWGYKPGYRLEIPSLGIQEA